MAFSFNSLYCVTLILHSLVDFIVIKTVFSNYLSYVTYVSVTLEDHIRQVLLYILYSITADILYCFSQHHMLERQEVMLSIKLSADEPLLFLLCILLESPS